MGKIYFRFSQGQRSNAKKLKFNVFYSIQQRPLGLKAPYFTQKCGMHLWWFWAKIRGKFTSGFWRVKGQMPKKLKFNVFLFISAKTARAKGAIFYTEMWYASVVVLGKNSGKIYFRFLESQRSNVKIP